MPYYSLIEFELLRLPDRDGSLKGDILYLLKVDAPHIAVPSMVVQPLPDQFIRFLMTVLVLVAHVDVIDHESQLLSIGRHQLCLGGRPQSSFHKTLQFLTSCRKVEAKEYVSGRLFGTWRVSIQNELSHDCALAMATWAKNKGRLACLQESVKQVSHLEDILSRNIDLHQILAPLLLTE
jgi:hypothetical protein